MQHKAQDDKAEQEAFLRKMQGIHRQMEFEPIKKFKYNLNSN